MENLNSTTPDALVDRAWLDLSLATVLGHTKTATALRERVRDSRHDTGIILHGSKGVGKRTLARLYARAVLCETPTEAGEACRTCGQCVSFIKSRPIGYTWLDATKDGDEKTARKLVGELNVGSVAARRVIVVGNADRCTNGAFDALLKTLEEPKSPITFILLAQVLAEVRLAGQSRCELYRLRPLDREDARVTLEAMLCAAGTSIDQRALDVLVAETGGRVGDMHAAVRAVAALSFVTLGWVRKALGHGWVEEVTAFWGTALSANEPPLEALILPLMDDARETQRRVQTVLLRLRPAVLGASAVAVYESEAALVHQHSVIRELSEMLAARAASLSRTPLDLWCALARLWLSDDHGDFDGLREAGRATRLVITEDVQALGSA